MNDITIIYLTTNRLPEKWSNFQINELLKSAGDIPIISLSVKPIDLGLNILQDKPLSKENIFYQLMRGVREVKTKYFAVCEDDTLYPPEHFTEFRPKDNEISFNQHRWALYSWNPIYSLKNYIRTNATMIAPTKLALEMLERRFAKYPMGTKMPKGMLGELGIYEKELGLPEVRVVEWKSSTPVVQADHNFFTPIDAEKETIERRHRKKMGVIQALEIPVWGKSKDLQQYFE